MHVFSKLNLLLWYMKMLVVSNKKAQFYIKFHEHVHKVNTPYFIKFFDQESINSWLCGHKCLENYSLFVGSKLGLQILFGKPFLYQVFPLYYIRKNSLSILYFLFYFFLPFTNIFFYGTIKRHP